MKEKQTDLFGDGQLDPSLLEHLDHLPDENNAWHEFNCTSTKILARHNDVTEQTIYEVCARMRKMEQTRRQPDLLG